MEGVTARTVTEAITILSNDKPVVDRHPEKRVKAAYQVIFIIFHNRYCFLELYLETWYIIQYLQTDV